MIHLAIQNTHYQCYNNNYNYVAGKLLVADINEDTML